MVRRRISSGLLGVILLLVLVVPLLTPVDPMQTNPANQLQAPSTAHPLGTDLLGRDVLSRVLHGGRLTLATAALATAIAFVIGAALGLIAGALHGWVDRGVFTLMNALLAVPGLMLALVMLTVLGRGVLPLAVAVGIAQLAPCAVVVRAAVMTVRSRTYIDAAHSMGAGQGWIMLRHILPNIRPTLVAYLGVIFSYSILNGAALSFLNLGADPGVPEWGAMLAEGRNAFRSAPWISAAPGVAITLTVWAINTLADSYILPAEKQII